MKTGKVRVKMSEKERKMIKNLEKESVSKLIREANSQDYEEKLG